MELSGRAHSSSALLPGKDLTLSFGQEAGWTPKTCLGRYGEEKTLHLYPCLEMMYDFIIIRPLALSTYRLRFPGTIYVSVTCRLNRKNNYTIICHVPTEATSSVTVANEACKRQDCWNLLDTYTLESRSIVILIRLRVRVIPFPRWERRVGSS
jgi:hypothetical protein